MKKVVMGIGLPGSGKTTILKPFAEKYDYQYICPDDIREELTGDAANQGVNREAWTIARERMATALKEGKTVVFDATFAKADERREFLGFARQQGAREIQGIFLDTPFEVALARNFARPRQIPEHSMRRMAENLARFPPELTDGFDILFTFDEVLGLKRLVRVEKEDGVEGKLPRS